MTCDHGIFRENDVGSQQYLIEGFGDLTLMVIAWWVVVLAEAPIVNLLWKSQTLSIRALEFSPF